MKQYFAVIPWALIEKPTSHCYTNKTQHKIIIIPQNTRKSSKQLSQYLYIILTDKTQKEFTRKSLIFVGCKILSICVNKNNNN